MDQQTPRVSVLTVLGAQQNLPDATLQSVLAQGLRNFEYVIVADSEISVSEDQRVRVVCLPGADEQTAWSEGLAQCRGAYVALLAPGDVSRSARLGRQAAWLDRDSSLELVGTASAPILAGPPGRPEPARTADGFMAWWLLAGGTMAWSSLMLRRDTVLAKGGLLRGTFEDAGDFDMCHRLSAAGSVARVDEVLTLCRPDPVPPAPDRQDAMRRVLQRAYADGLGTRAALGATLVARYVIGDAPVPDTATLGEVERILFSLGQWLNDENRIDAMTRALIATEREALRNRLNANMARGRKVAPAETPSPGLWPALRRLWGPRRQPAALWP